MVPPWRELFVNDVERRHDFGAAVEEYRRIDKALDALGYVKTELPKVSVRKRAEIVIHTWGAL